jgi:hypothetical protein
MKQSSARLVLVISILAFSLSLFIPPAQGQEKVKIGVIAPLTGAMAQNNPGNLAIRGPSWRMRPAEIKSQIWPGWKSTANT